MLREIDLRLDSFSVVWDMELSVSLMKTVDMTYVLKTLNWLGDLIGN